MFRVEGGLLLYNDVKFGPSDLIYVNNREIKRDRTGLERVSTPEEIDYLFVAGKYVIGVESKKPNDLLNSWKSRRLARQLNTLRSTCDVAVLMLRGGWPSVDPLNRRTPTSLYIALLHYLQCGIYIVAGPEKDKDLSRFLRLYRSHLKKQRAPLTALEGTDQIVKTSANVSILRAVRGVGERLERRLLEEYGSPLAALNGTSEEWKKLGANRSVIGEKEKL
jgi:ERCC4-type nuclease